MNNRRFDWTSLLLAVIFFIAAIITFLNPSFAFDVFIIGIGTVILVHAIILIVNYFRHRNDATSQSLLWSSLISGIIEVVFALIIVLYPGISETVLTYLFVIWFLSIFIRGLFSVGILKLINNAVFWVALIIDILGIILAIFLIANPLSAYLTIPMILGAEFLFSAIINLFYAFVGEEVE